MFSKLFGKRKEEKKGSDFVIEEEEDEGDAFVTSLQLNLARLIAYAESADVRLQRDVAEKLANEAVKPERQIQIVSHGGLKLLIPLTKSADNEVQRLAAHALANLSVNADNQRLMASEGAIEVLIDLLGSVHLQTQRQSAKALANLGVHHENKRLLAEAGAIPKLVRLTEASVTTTVRIEAVAALANLAVNDQNEIEIEACNGIRTIVAALRASLEFSNSFSGARDREFNNVEELTAQCARALRNLSVNARNKKIMVDMEVIADLQHLLRHSNERIAQQSKKALANLGALSSEVSRK